MATVLPQYYLARSHSSENLAPIPRQFPFARRSGDSVFKGRAMSQFEHVAVAYNQAVCLDRISSVLQFLTVFTVTLAMLSLWHGASAQTVQPAQSAAPNLTLTKIDDVGRGGLLLKTKYEGYYLEAPSLATDVAIDVHGLIARTKITQRFENPSEEWVEGIYVFPLPHMAAVDTLKMQIGERFIEGQVKERQEARRVYEAARDAGQRASLVEQERPNMFTNSVANIGPGETVIIQIEYQESIQYDSGQFQIRFPMVVGPRFIPPLEAQLVSFDGAQEGEVVLRDPVPDAHRITPPVLHPTQGQRNPITMTVMLNAGFPIDLIKSPHHDIRVRRLAKDKAKISFVNQDEVANRDFELIWDSKSENAPHTALFKETKDGKTYVKGFILPPKQPAADRVYARETIFVIDNSGSMGGASMRQAKESLIFALSTLKPGDRFNVIRFDDTTDSVFQKPQAVSNQSIAVAKRYIERLEADGGTMMLPALQAALDDVATDQNEELLRQVVFLTDGAIGNEAQLFEEIDSSLGRSRLFTVGIGSAPNSYFMLRAARLGRGTFTHIGSERQVTERMSDLLTKLQAPVLTDLKVTSENGNEGEIWPNPLPDLYAGEPVIFTAVISNANTDFTVSGKTLTGNWTSQLSIDDAKEASGIAKLWARNKIASLEEWRFQGARLDRIDGEILKVALNHHLVTRLTSLVAVDHEIARPATADIIRQDVPLNLPEGWDFDKVFGEQIPTRRASYQSPEAKVMLASLRTPSATGALPNDSGTAGIALPQGSTDRWFMFIIGLACMIGGLVMSVLQWREIRQAAERPLL